MSNFTLNTKTDNLFLIGLSEIEQRLDAEFYLEDFDFTDFIKLRNIAKVKGGKRLPKGFYYSKDETDYLYLQISNLDSDNEINWQTAKYISKEVFEILERYETVEGDLVFSIAGSVGKINVVKNIPEGKKVILTENASKIHFKNGVQVIPEFIELVLKTPLLQKQINLNYIQTTIPKIGLDRIENLFIPELPSIEKQQECLDFFKSAFESKLEKKREAKNLLSSIDGYLLGELGIKLPKKDNSLTARVFTSKLSEVSNRLDSGFYHPFYSSMENNIKKNKSSKLGNLVKFSNETWNQKDGFETVFPYIEISEINLKTGEINLVRDIEIENAPSRAKMIVRTDDIIISTTRPHRGAISKIQEIHNKSIASTGFSVIRDIKDEDLEREYLFEVLRNSIVLLQMKQRSTGGNYPAITQEELSKVLIPLPEVEKQLEIVNHIQDLKLEVKQLEEEAKESLNQAKLEVEKIILG